MELINRQLRLTISGDDYARFQKLATKRKMSVERLFIATMKKVLLGNSPKAKPKEKKVGKIYLGFAKLAGIIHPKEFKFLTDEEILSVEGLGKAALERIRGKYTYED